MDLKFLSKIKMEPLDLGEMMGGYCNICGLLNRIHTSGRGCLHEIEKKLQEIFREWLITEQELISDMDDG